MSFKPLLAATLEDADLKALEFPLYATPKIDGIRCLLMESGELQANQPRTRSLKDIQNRHIREKLAAKLPVGLDGEIWTHGATCFGDVSSAVMKRTGTPDFTFYIFDWFNRPGTYLARTEELRRHSMRWPEFCTVLAPIQMPSLKQLLKYEKAMLKQGYEGIMLRRGDGRYKHGRSTLNERILMKLKRLTDGEAIVIGFEEQMHNENELEQDNLGHAKRSSKKAGMKPAGTLGKLIVIDCVTRGEFGIGTGRGLTQELRAKIWGNKSHYMGQIVKYQHQTHGAKDAARIPIMLGFRSKEDM